MLERIPEEHFDWKPHAKSFSLAELSAHIANVPWWIVSTVEEEHFDMATPFPARPTPTSRAEVLATFDENAKQAKAAVATVSEERMRGNWSLLSGGQTIFSRPRVDVVREFGLSHMIHHRGQLSVYLRELDVPLPPIFGPTADDQTAG